MEDYLCEMNGPGQRPGRKAHDTQVINQSKNQHENGKVFCEAINFYIVQYAELASLFGVFCPPASLLSLSPRFTLWMRCKSGLTIFPL